MAFLAVRDYSAATRAMSPPSSRPAMPEPRRPSPSPRLGRIKGFAFAEFMTWYADRHDRPTILESLGAAGEWRKVSFSFDRPGFGILASEWYEAEIVHAVLDAVGRRHTPLELDVLAREAADEIMGKMLRGIYRTAFSICVTPERYLRHVDKVWRLQYDNGTPVIIAPRSTEHAITFRDWRSHHPIICRLNMASAGPIYGAMGCKSTKYTRLGCISEGAQRCQSVVVWT